MAKTLQDYLGSSATLSSGSLSVNINDLYGIIFPDSPSPQNLPDNPDIALAVLLGALHKRAQPIFDSDGLDATPNTQAVVSSESFQERIFEVRGEVSQIKHEFVFNVYTEDTTGFDPLKTV